ncbi:PREDICTED: two-component response regulator-like APRR5 [Ipomoea nil]|uniref:two-component response regulator-like APRR5 n=1 Tax=Ipomoea nil TaxID=35883 RepID=UPI0009017093|nr:PREDICTED: two-component response regulator-like APRR5 [Ipomoea nil]
MGEVGSEGGAGVELNDESGGSAAVFRWERFVAKMAVRVLLVEADDSTRHIISALLRKCGYKVAAVSDGLKAWEVLNKKPHNVDLILAEVDLPSISGYALLTLIMEHEVCKNIPVIMMCSQDSVSTAYGCMLRGATDFLVKPIRKNELTNLWQHVWRRQASSSGAMAENNDISNGECREKGSEDQSSCSKPDIDTEGEITEQIQDLLQPNWDRSLPIVDQASDEDIKSCEQGIDLIGAFDDYLNCNHINPSSNTSPNKVDSAAPELDLSLTRTHPSSMLNQFVDKHRLNHSDGSAFTPYVNKGTQKHQGLTIPIAERGVRFEGVSSPVISPSDSPPGSGNVDSPPLEPNPVHPSTAECRKEEVSPGQDGNSHRSSQREAALTKFRLKRKDRCYEKKVRYESRKKLAEQRPRVKGQFVRRQATGTGAPPGDNVMISTVNQ